jgi:predicted ATP-grasp superfamily ATP-dependent carboligase
VGQPVLIAAFSGRALAQSARRAGYEPLVVDAFGDLDTRKAAADIRVVDGALQRGFKTEPVVAALEALASAARSPPIGLVLGSGFEDKPGLIATLAKHFRLLGNSPEAIAASKEPATFFATLDKLNVPHPETRVTPPDNPADGWLTKRTGGSGGRHIRVCRAGSAARRRRYFQKRLVGERLSIGGLFAPGGAEFALTRQWIAPSPQNPFRFGGAVSMPDIDPSLYRRLAEAASNVATGLSLVGIASFDFIVADGQPYLLEVNPRPGASLDVLDDEHGRLFGAHVAACLGIPLQTAVRSTRPARAMAILHADRGPLTFGDTPWPSWSADRGRPGTFVPQGAPLATAFADAPTADEAQRLAAVRLAELEDLIYENAKS